MSDQKQQHRSAGFLYPNERAYLAERGMYFGQLENTAESSGRRSKSSIRNEVLLGTQFENIITSFHQDLLAVVNFQLSSDGFEQFAWSKGTLAPAKPRIEALRNHLNTLIELLEADYMETEREALREALAVIYRPLEEEFDGVWDASERKFDPNDQNTALSGETLNKVYSRQKELQELLKLVLERDDRLEILKHLQHSGKSDFDGERVGADGEPWSRVASRELVPELVTKDDTWQNQVEYELTESGEALLDCWEAITETAPVQIKQDLNPNRDKKENVLELLAEHFPENFA